MKKYSLEGVDGNAYAVMGYVISAMKLTGYKSEQIGKYQASAISSDYSNLIRVSADQIDECNKSQVADELRKYIIENANLADWELGQGLAMIGRREPLPQGIKDMIDQCIADFQSNYEDDEDYAEFIDTWAMPEDDEYEDYFYAICGSRSIKK